MFTLPFKPYSNFSYGMHGSMMEALPTWGGGAQGSGQLFLALNTFNGNFFIKTTPLLIEDLGGPIDLSYCFNSRTPDFRSKWHLSCLSEIVEQGASSITIIEFDGSEVTYSQRERNVPIFSAPKNSPHAGAVCHQKDNDGFEWFHPSSGDKRTYCSRGYLLETSNAQGHVLKYTYDVFFLDSLLACITSSSGHEYHFSWKTQHECDITLKSHQHKTEKLLASYTFRDTDRQQLAKIEIKKGPGFYATKLSYEHDLLSGIIQDDGTSIQLGFNPGYQLVKLALGDGASYGIFAPFMPDAPLVIRAEGVENKADFNFRHDENGRYDRVSYHVPDDLGVDAMVESTAFMWDDEGDGVLKRILRMDNSYRDLSYDLEGHIIEISEFDASNTCLTCKTFGYSAQGVLIATSDLHIQENYELETTHFIYDFKADNTRDLTFVVRPGGNVEYFTYDEHRLLDKHYQYFSLFDGAPTLNALRDWQSALTPAQQQNVLLTLHEHNERGQVIAKSTYQNTDAATIYQQTFSKTMTGALLTHRRMNSVNELMLEVYERDAIDRVTLHKTPLSEETNTSYSKQAEVKKLPNGLIVTDSYNSSHQLVSRLYSNGREEIREYTPSGQLSYLKTSEGLTTHYFYNKKDELVYEFNGAGELTAYARDHVNHVFSTTRFAVRYEEEHSDITLITQFAKSHLNDANNRCHQQIKDCLGRIVFELETCDERGYVTVVEFKYNSLGEKTETIAYANSLTPEEAGALLLSHAMPEHRKTASDRTSRQIFQHGKLVAQIDVAGYVVLNHYNGAGLIHESVMISQPLSTTEQEALGANPTILQLDDQIGARTLYFYDVAGNQTMMIDALGYVTAYEYDLSGQKSGQRRYAIALDVANLTVDIIPQLPAETDEDDHIIYIYDLNGRCIQEKHLHEGYELIKAYDKLGHVVSEVTQAINDIDGDKNGDTYRASETSYNQMGEKIQGINPMVMDTHSNERFKKDHVEHVTRDKNGLVTISYNALNEATYYFYGDQNRLAFNISPAGVVTRYDYNAFGEVTCQAASTHVIELSAIENFCSLGGRAFEVLMASLRDSDGEELHFVGESTVYNPLGLVTEICDADGYRHIKTYNAFKEIKCEKQQREKAREDSPALFLETHYMWEKRGLIIKALTKSTNSIKAKEENKQYNNPRGNCTYSKKTDTAAYHERYDLLGRLIHRSIEDIDVRTGERNLVELEQKQWDAFSRVIHHTMFVDDNTQQLIVYTHNRKARSMLKMQDDAHETTYTNIFGDVISHANAKNFITKYSHNALGDVSSKCIVWSNREITMRLSKTFDMAGRVTQLVENNALEQIFTRNPDGFVIKKESRSLNDHGTRVDTYKVDGLGRTVQHINPEGGICNYEYSDGGQLVLSVIDPHGLNIQTHAMYNGLKQKVLESLSDGHAARRYETQFRQDHLARSHAKIIDPQGLALTSSVVRNRADHIIQSIDGNGHASYRVLDGCGNPILTISAMGIVQESRYNHAGQVTYVRRYTQALNSEQINQFFNQKDVINTNYRTQNWSELFAVLESIARVDDKQLSISYHTNGKKCQVVKHFYDHEHGQSKVYKYTYTYSVTGKMLSQRMQSDHEQARQTFYFYDEADNQTLIISPLGLITENIFNRDGKIIHSIEYAEPLEDKLHQQLKQGVTTDSTAVLKHKIRTHKTKQLTQNLHVHYVFDAYHNPIFTVDNKGLVSRYYYDSNNHKVKTIHFAQAFDLHTEVDISSIDNKLFKHYSLDALSEADRVYQDVFDKAGRLVQEVDPHGMTDIFERDAADLIIAHTDRAGQKTTNEYDLAKRRIAEILPEAPVTDVFIEGEGDVAQLNFSSTKRRVKNTQRFDKTDKVIAKTHDVEHDARTVRIHYDLDGRYTGTQVDQVEVDDKEKTPKHMMDHPITYQTLSSSLVLHASGKPMVEKDEEGAYSFKVYDGLDRLRYEINAVGLVTSYERDDFGSPLKATEYATALVFEADDFQRFVQEGIEASWLKDQVQALATDNDRVKQYTYDHEGRLLQTMTGLRHYYEPSSGTFYQSHGLVKQNYDVFGRVIERLTLMDAALNETWHKHYFWYERGQRHYVLEAESYKGSTKDADNLFKITAIRYDVFGDPVLRHQYAEAIELNVSRQDLSLSRALARLPTGQNKQDRIHAYTFNFDGKETSVKLVNRTHQIVDAHGQIIDVMDDLGDVDDARKDIELECAYAPRGERVVTTNAQGDKQWAFIDARGLTFATVDLPVVSGQDAKGKAILAYPLTYFYHNAHGEQVGSKEFWYGAEPTTLTHPYELPQALNEAVEHDFLSLDLKDTRGLTKLEQKGTKQTGYSYTATKQKAREFVSRLSDIKNESRVIDEKRHTFNLAKRPVLEESIRGGSRIDHHSTRSTLNAWGECVEKAFLSAPNIKSITRWSQGHAWFSHQDKDLPTLEFSNMVGDITLAVRAHDDVLSGFEYEAQAIDFIKHHRYNNRVLKDIKSYDFAHHALKHEQPATANFEPIETQLLDVDVNVGFEFLDNSTRAISWRNIDDHDAHLVGFIRIIKGGSNITPNTNAYGVEKACFDHQRNMHYFDVNHLDEGAYDVEIFAFKEEHVSLDVPLSGVQPVFSGRYPIEIAGEEYRLLDANEMDILNVHVRIRKLPHVSVKLELWDNLPASYQTAKLDVKVRNNRGSLFNLVNQAVPNKRDKSSVVKIEPYYFRPLNLTATSFQLTLENHVVIKIGTALRAEYKTEAAEFGDYGLRSYLYMRDLNPSSLSKLRVGNAVYRLSAAESDSINTGKVIDITGQHGAPELSNPDRQFHAVSTPRWSQISEKPRRTNRIISSTFDVFSNNTTFVNELGHVWQKKYNAYNRVLETLDPEINSMVAPADVKQGDLTYTAQTTQLIAQFGYDLNGEKIAYAEGFNHVTDGATMKPASTIERAPNGQSIREVDATGVMTSQTFYSAMKLPVSVLTEGLSQPLRIRYQGKHAQDVLFSGANVGLYMSNQALLYRMYRDPLTDEIIGLGVPRTAGAGNTSFAVAYARYDDLGQINARALPEGQISQFKKDTMGNVLTATTPLSTTTYQRQPFSGLIQKIGDSTASGNWDYESNRLNLVVIKKQHGAVHTVTHYNAELLASTHCLNADTLSEYAYDNAGNITQLMRTMQGLKETMTASYNAAHHMLLTDHTHFTQRYTSDPFYNQVMSELVLKMDGGPAKYTSISLGYSFDDGHRIVRNSVPCSWLQMAAPGTNPSGFVAHMPTFKQGGIRIYDQRANLQSEIFDQNSIAYERDALARISKINYYGRGGGSKYLRYDAKGPVRYSVLKQDIQSNTLGEKHVNALNNAQNEAFRNGSLVIEAWDKSRVDFFVHQLRHAYEYDLNFTTRFTEDTFTSVFNRTINILNDGLTVQKTFSQVRDKSWTGATIYDYEYKQDYFCYQSTMILPTRLYSRERRVKNPWGVEGQNTVTYSGSQAVGMQGDGDKVLTTQLSGFEQLHRVTHTDKETLIKKFPQFKSKRHPERLNFYNKQSVHFMMGIHEEYLGSVATTSIQENAWRTTVDSLSPDDAFCLSKPNYSSNIFHGEYVINPFREPVTRDPDVHEHGEVKVSAATGEIQRNTRYSARLKRDFASGVASSFEQGIKIADPVNEVSVVDAALAPPSWVPLEKTLHISDPMFVHLPAYQKAMLPFIADEKGNLPSGLLLAISQGVMNHLKMGTKASTALAFQQAMQLGAPHAKPYHKKSREYFLEIFVTILVSMIIIAIAPAAAGVLFSIEEGAAATALEMGLVSSLLDAGLKGAAYKTHLISHYSLVDSVGVGFSAGLGYGLGVLGTHPTAGLKEALTYAVANNIETQLTEMAKHHQDGLNIRSLLASIVTTITRQRVGVRLDMLDGALGRSTQDVKGMVEMLMLDFLGATITGQEVNLKFAVFNSLTSAMMSEVIHAVQADMPSMTPHAKEDKLKGGRNLPPHSKPESQRLGSSQKRYNEKQHQKAILASYGNLPAANDAFFKEPVKEFMSDMRHDVSLDFDADTGHLIFDPLESHLHSSHVRVSTPNSGMHSKTTTGQHQQAREQHARARAVPGKPGDSFGGSGLGLFSRNSVTKEQVMLDAACYLDHVSSPKNKAGFVDKSKQVLSAAGHEIYDHPVRFGLDVSPLGWMDSAQGVFTGHSFIHGADLNRGWAAVGALPVLGVAAKYGRPLVSRGSTAVAGVFGRNNVPNSSHAIDSILEVSHPLEGMTPQQVITKVNELGLHTKKDNLVLWSGLGQGSQGVKLAQQYVAKHGGTTLEMTPGGAWLDRMKLFENGSPFALKEAAHIWDETSKLFTRQANGQVRSLIGQVRPQSIYLSQEILELNINPRVTGIDELYLRPRFETVLR
ncbi:MAG: hypothetical protein P1U36_07240 [Legionellaceae bacterium]|nr:hypothetical protein [Legionellaceae bacterium]